MVSKINVARIECWHDGRYRLVVDAPTGGVVLYLGEGSDGSFATEEDAIEKALEVGILDPERERKRQIESSKHALAWDLKPKHTA
jgi:hypothetical protein